MGDGKAKLRWEPWLEWRRSSRRWRRWRRGEGGLNKELREDDLMELAVLAMALMGWEGDCGSSGFYEPGCYSLLNDLHSIRPLTKATLTDTQERLVTSLLLNRRGYLRANHWK